MSEAITYGKYLKIDELLELQQAASEVEHDELLFIAIHQIYELWFKVVLHELDYGCQLLRSADVHRSLHTLKRIPAIFKVLVA